MRGKNSLSVTEIVLSSGSLPRVREKPDFEKWIHGQARITPASAGKTSSNLTKNSKQKDHPRVCGKNFTCSARTKIALGSPPRVREKQLILQFINYTSRITPAYAGKTQLQPAPRHLLRDHPRVCRKNLLLPRCHGRCSVSPSCVREKHIRHLEDGKSLGITPAYAGKT